MTRPGAAHAAQIVSAAAATTTTTTTTTTATTIPGDVFDPVAALEQLRLLLRRYNENPRAMPDMVEQIRALFPGYRIPDTPPERLWEVVQLLLVQFAAARVIDRPSGVVEVRLNARRRQAGR